MTYSNLLLHKIEEQDDERDLLEAVAVLYIEVGADIKEKH